jgi:hypothetical protein
MKSKAPIEYVGSVFVFPDGQGWHVESEANIRSAGSRVFRCYEVPIPDFGFRNFSQSELDSATRRLEATAV